MRYTDETHCYFCAVFLDRLSCFITHTIVSIFLRNVFYLLIAHSENYLRMINHVQKKAKKMSRSHNGLGYRWRVKFTLSIHRKGLRAYTPSNIEFAIRWSPLTADLMGLRTWTQSLYWHWTSQMLFIFTKTIWNSLTRQIYYAIFNTRVFAE